MSAGGCAAYHLGVFRVEVVDEISVCRPVIIQCVRKLLPPFAEVLYSFNPAINSGRNSFSPSAELSEEESEEPL